MPNYVFSTLTANTAYAIYNYESHDLPIIEKQIVIKGGANLADKNLVTPQGVMTEVSDEDLALLEQDYHFKDHIKNGFIKVEKRKAEVEKAVKDMKDKDRSAPLTDKDFEKDGPKPLKAGK